MAKVGDVQQGQSGEAIMEQTTNYPCASCGGMMVFHPKTQKLRCEHCGTETDIESVTHAPEEHDFTSAPRPEQMDWGMATRVIRCQSCGAETLLEKGATAQFCAFCGSPQITEDVSAAGIAPESLVPFSVDESAANTAFRQWLSKRHFAPGALQNAARQGKLRGIYLPHWTYDARTSSSYTGREGHHYYETETYTETENGKTVTKTRQVQKTRWSRTSGFVSRDFDDVLVRGSRHVDMGLLNGIQPFDLRKLTRYAPQFLSGFLSEKASVSLDEGWADAKLIIDNAIHDDCRDDILSHADEADVDDVHTSYRGITYKLMLLPVWMTSYTFKNKHYQIMVNGQTGRVKGESPLSALKVALLTGGILAVVALIVWLCTR